MSLPSSFLCSYPAPVVNAIRLTNLVILDFIQNRSKALPVKRNIYVPLHTLALVVDWLLCLVHSCLWISLKSALSAYVLWHNAYLSSFVCMQSAPQPTLHSLLALWRTMCSSRRWCPYDAHWSPPGLHWSLHWSALVWATAAAPTVIPPTPRLGQVGKLS